MISQIFGRQFKQQKSKYALTIFPKLLNSVLIFSPSYNMKELSIQCLKKERTHRKERMAEQKLPQYDLLFSHYSVDHYIQLISENKKI